VKGRGTTHRNLSDSSPDQLSKMLLPKETRIAF